MGAFGWMLVIGYLLGGGTVEVRFQRWLHKRLPGGFNAIGDEFVESVAWARRHCTRKLQQTRLVWGIVGAKWEWP